MAINTPTLHTATGATLTAPPFPLNHARILYDNVLDNYSTLANSSGTNPTYAVVPNTYQRFTFNGFVSIEFTLPAAVSIDCICLGAALLSGYTVAAEYSETDGGAWVALAPDQSPTDTHALMFYTETSVSAKRIRVQCTGTGDGYIGYVSAGIALQMQRPFFAGHTPITDGDVTRYFHNKSEAGHIIGQQIRSQGYQSKASFNNINDNWYRTYFAPFKQAAKLKPFFFAWNLLEYPQDIGFCRIAKDISAAYSGSRTLRSIDFDLLGI